VSLLRGLPRGRPALVCWRDATVRFLLGQIVVADLVVSTTLREFSLVFKILRLRWSAHGALLLYTDALYTDAAPGGGPVDATSG
jgi:hypothetical protein